MDNRVDHFVNVHKKRLQDLLERYLSGDVRHEDAREVAWSIVDEWNGLQLADETPRTGQEDLLWATVWSLQHCADEGHWNDGVTKQTLEPLHNALANNTGLPAGYSGNRP